VTRADLEASRIALLRKLKAREGMLEYRESVAMIRIRIADIEKQLKQMANG
jgi:hypothetical protein